MRKELHRASRGDIGRAVYGEDFNWNNFSSIREPILKLMESVDGAEFVNGAYYDKKRDAYFATYFVTQEAVCVSVYDQWGEIRFAGHGLDEVALDAVGEKIGKVLAQGRKR